MRTTLSKRHIYYVGSHEGCGCGFRKNGSLTDDEDEVEARRTQTSHHELATYLRRNIERVRTIEMFACWEGDQGKPAKNGGVIDPMVVADESFYFEELTLWTISLAP